MLFWIFLFITVVSINSALRSDKYGSVSIICGLIGFAVTLTFGLLGLFAADKDHYMSAELRKYESLMYRYEHETDLVKRSETIIEIAEWNEDLKWCKEHQDNFWFGFMIPDIYDELEYIELKEE